MKKCKQFLAVTIALTAAAAAQPPSPGGERPQARPGLRNDDVQHRLEERGNLVPGERDAKLKQWRERSGPGKDDPRREEFKSLTPEQRETKRAELKARLEKRVFELRQKQADGIITAEETRELERREQILKRFGRPPPPKDQSPGVPKPPQDAPKSP